MRRRRGYRGSFPWALLSPFLTAARSSLLAVMLFEAGEARRTPAALMVIVLYWML